MARLRVAFQWLTANNWPWLLATKEDVDLHGDNLGARLEELLRAYANSVGEHGPAVPAGLLQSAAQIDESRARIQTVLAMQLPVMTMRTVKEPPMNSRTSARPFFTVALMMFPLCSDGIAS